MEKDFFLLLLLFFYLRREKGGGGGKGNSAAKQDNTYMFKNYIMNTTLEIHNIWIFALICNSK